MEPLDGGVPVRSDQFPASGPNSLGSIGRRLAGRLIDGFIIGIPGSLALAPHFDPDDAVSPYDGPAWLYYLVVLVVPAIYEIAFVAWRGQTIGKLAMGLRVARVDDGAVPNLYQAAVRALLPIAVANIPLQPISSLAAIGIYLAALMSPLRQGLHDRAAGTVVVSTR